jgi:hypothetical protein
MALKKFKPSAMLDFIKSQLPENGTHVPISIKTLAKELGCCEMTARRNLKQLIDNAEISISGNISSNNATLPNTIVVLSAYIEQVFRAPQQPDTPEIAPSLPTVSLKAEKPIIITQDLRTLSSEQIYSQLDAIQLNTLITQAQLDIDACFISATCDYVVKSAIAKVLAWHIAKNLQLSTNNCVAKVMQWGLRSVREDLTQKTNKQNGKAGNSVITQLIDRAKESGYNSGNI